MFGLYNVSAVSFDSLFFKLLIEIKITFFENTQSQIVGEKGELLVIACHYVGLHELLSVVVGWQGLTHGGTGKKLFLEKAITYNVACLVAEWIAQMPYARQWMDGDMSGLYVNMALAVVYSIGCVRAWREVDDEEADDEKEDAGAFATNVQRYFIAMSVLFGVWFLLAPLHAVASYGAHIVPGETAVGDLYLFAMRLFGAFMLSSAVYGYHSLQSSLEIQANALFTSVLSSVFSFVIVAGGHGNWVEQYGDAAAKQGWYFNMSMMLFNSIVSYMAYKRVQEQI